MSMGDTISLRTLEHSHWDGLVRLAVHLGLFESSAKLPPYNKVRHKALARLVHAELLYLSWGDD